MNIRSDQKAILAAFFCNFFWGLSFLASRIALNEASVSVLLSHRFLVAFFVMSIYDIWGAEMRRQPKGQELLDHRQLFLSRRAAASFGHYADAQLRRLQNAIARDTLPQPSREEHILRSVKHAMDDFNRKQKEKNKNEDFRHLLEQ